MADTTIPSLSIPLDGPQINITIPQTQATVADQGYTYNQAGFTYNQPGWQYGGVTNATQDLSAVPELTFSDIYTAPPPGNTYHSVGPGWFMFVTIP